MNLNTSKIKEYVDFLEENSRNILLLCNRIEENLASAIQYMDQKSGLLAARGMAMSIENIKKSVPINEESCKILILVLKRLAEAQNCFGRER